MDHADFPVRDFGQFTYCHNDAGMTDAGFTHGYVPQDEFDCDPAWLTLVSAERLLAAVRLVVMDVDARNTATHVGLIHAKPGDSKSLPMLGFGNPSDEWMHVLAPRVRNLEESEVFGVDG